MRNRLVGVLKALAIALVQFVAANITTLLLSFPFNMQPEKNPWGVAAVLTVTSLIGVAAGGWVGIRIGWVPGPARLATRMAVALVCVVAVLGVALAAGGMREASPFLTGAMAAGIAGFHVAGLIGGKE